MKSINTTEIQKAFTQQASKFESNKMNFSKQEFFTLYEQSGMKVEFCETTKIPVILQNWMEHTQTPTGIQKDSISKMEEDIDGGVKTGFSPYRKNDRIQFDVNLYLDRKISYGIQAGKLFIEDLLF